MKQFGKVFKFEFGGYIKNKAFVGTTLFLVAAIILVMFLPNIIGAFKKDDSSESVEKPVMLVYSEDKVLSENLSIYFSDVFADYEVKVTDDSIDNIKESVTAGVAECAFVLDGATSYTYYVNNFSLYDSNTSLANQALTEAYRMTGMVQSGLTPEQAADIMNVSFESKVETLGKNQAENFFYTYIMIFALYMVIMLYGQMVATNVATEKSSRAMELLVTSVNPNSMLFGKVFASCVAGFLQLFAVFGTAILCFNLNRSSLSNPIITSIFDMPVDLFVYMLVFFVLGFLIFAFMYAALGSMATKLEDINTLVTPISFLFIIGFMVVIFSMTGGDVDTLLMKVCSYIPFTSPMAMFTRIAMGTVAWYEIMISIALLIVSTLGIGVLSAKIYRAGVLLYGMPPSFSNVIKTVFKKKN